MLIIKSDFKSRAGYNGAYGIYIWVNFLQQSFWVNFLQQSFWAIFWGDVWGWFFDSDVFGAIFLGWFFVHFSKLFHLSNLWIGVPSFFFSYIPAAYYKVSLNKDNKQCKSFYEVLYCIVPSYTFKFRQM